MVIFYSVMAIYVKTSANMILRSGLQFLKSRLYRQFLPTNFIKVCEFSNDALLDVSNDNSKITSEEEIMVLKFLNETSPDEILRMKAGKAHLRKLIDLRSQNGGFQSLSQIYSGRGMNTKVLDKIVSNVLNNEFQQKGKKEKQKPRGQLIEPILLCSEIQEITSVTAIYIDYNTVCWARIERDMYCVTDWQLYNIECDSNRKMHLNEIIKAALYIVDSLPKSQIYVMESEPTVLRSTGANVNNPKMVHVNLQKSQLVAVLSGMITAMGNSRKFSSDEHTYNEMDFVDKMYYLRSTLPSRFFKTLIGNERISSLPIIDKLINTGLIYESNEEHLLTFLEECKNEYENKKDFEKEHLGKALMLLITFYETCIFQDSKAIAKFNL